MMMLIGVPFCVLFVNLIEFIECCLDVILLEFDVLKMRVNGCYAVA